MKPKRAPLPHHHTSAYDPVRHAVAATSENSNSLLSSLTGSPLFWVLGFAISIGAAIVLLAEMEARWIVYSSLALIASLVFMVSFAKEKLLVTAFILSLQIDVYIRLFYGVSGSTEGLAFPLVFLAGSALLVYQLATGKRSIKSFQWAGASRLPIMLILGTTFFSLLLTSERFIGLSRLLFSLELYFIYCMVLNLIQSKADIDRIVKLLLLTLAFQSIVYFIENSLGVTFDFVGETKVTGAIPRPGGTVSSNPAGFASFITPILMITLAAFVVRRRSLQAPFLPLLALMGSGAIALTFTRASWAGLVLGLVVVCLLAFRRRILNIAKVFFLALSAGAASMFLMPMMLARVEGDYGKVSALDERIGLIKIALNVISEHPIEGIGPGAYSYIFKRYLPHGMDQWLYTVHNEFLLRAAETGILGGVAFALLLVVAFRCGLRLSRAKIASIQVIGIGWAGAVVALAWQMSWVPWTGFSYNAMLWLMLGLTDGVDRLVRQNKLEPMVGSPYGFR